MAAAALHHMIPHPLRSNGPNQDTESLHGPAVTGVNQREEQGRIVVPWQQDHESPRGPISISDIVDHNQLGHSASLRVEDFDLLKTLGTGARRSRDCETLVADSGQVPLQEYGWQGWRGPRMVTRGRCMR
jgi:hypothetical protein